MHLTVTLSWISVDNVGFVTNVKNDKTLVRKSMSLRWCSIMGAC